MHLRRKVYWEVLYHGKMGERGKGEGKQDVNMHTFVKAVSKHYKSNAFSILHPHLHPPN